MSSEGERKDVFPANLMTVILRDSNPPKVLAHGKVKHDDEFVIVDLTQVSPFLQPTLSQLRGDTVHYGREGVEVVPFLGFGEEYGRMPDK